MLFCICQSSNKSLCYWFSYYWDVSRLLKQNKALKENTSSADQKLWKFQKKWLLTNYTVSIFKYPWSIASYLFTGYEKSRYIYSTLIRELRIITKLDWKLLLLDENFPYERSLKSDTLSMEGLFSVIQLILQIWQSLRTYTMVLLHRQVKATP